jgi:Transposase
VWDNFTQFVVSRLRRARALSSQIPDHAFRRHKAGSLSAINVSAACFRARARPARPLVSLGHPPAPRAHQGRGAHHQAALGRKFDSRIANGLIEGINSLVQAAKAKARRYRTLRNLKAITTSSPVNSTFGYPREIAGSLLLSVSDCVARCVTGRARLGGFARRRRCLTAAHQ